MRVVFLGTPEFAVASLHTLLRHPACEVVGVVTAPDRRGGRGGKHLIESAVKRAAAAAQLPVLQPTNLKGRRFLADLRALAPELQVVVAFRMLPRLVWELPPLGTVNVHGSLLPAYRGAAPIHWAVINGESVTGVSVFLLRHAIDTGDVLHQRSLDISPDETTGDVYERLMHLGAEALGEALDLIAAGTAQGVPQDVTEVSHAPKVFHADGRVDFSQSLQRVHDFIRGMTPVPGAWTVLNDKEVKILAARPTEIHTNVGPGSLLPLAADEGSVGLPTVGVSCADGVIELVEVKPAGKRAQSGADFRNGLRLSQPIAVG